MNPTSTQQMKGVYSMKVLVHKLSLSSAAFPEKKRTIVKPSVKVKFVDFPRMEINARRDLTSQEFSKKHLINKTFSNAFGIGKAVCLNAKASEMAEYLRSYALIVQLKELEETTEQERTVGKCHVDMDMFIEDSKVVIQEEIERFRRNTFTLIDRNQTCIGWIDISISLVQRPVSYVSKTISKRLGSLETSQAVSTQGIHALNSNNNNTDKNASKANSVYGEDKERDRQISFDESASLKRQRSGTAGQEAASVYIKHKNSVEEQTPSMASPKLNQFQSSNDDYYMDDFEASSVQGLASKVSIGKQNSRKLTGYDESDAGTERYDEDFESMSASYGVSVGSLPKRNSIGNTSGRRKSLQHQQAQQEVASNRQVDDDAISEVYTEDFDSMTLSTSVQKTFPKTQKLQARR